MVVGRDGPEVRGAHFGRLAFLIEEADDTGGVLQDLDDAVEKDAIEAGVIKTDSRPMVLEKGVHNGPPDREWKITLDDSRACFLMGISRGKAPCLELGKSPDSLHSPNGSAGIENRLHSRRPADH